MEKIKKDSSEGVDEKENDFNIQNSILLHYKIID